MAICNSGEKLSQEATGIRRGRVYPVAKNENTGLHSSLSKHR